MTSVPLTASVPQPTVRHWIAALRLPFTSVAVVPFAVGAYLAYAHGRLASPLAAFLGVLAVFLTCVGCHLIGEICDQQEDLETLKYQRSQFSGGTLLVAQGVLSQRAVGIAAASAFALVGVLGLTIVWIHQSLTLLGLGAFGMACAAFYSLPPVRLAKRGIAEIFIGLCYGWLTIVTGYASASGDLPANSGLISLPVALGVFNVIFFNEISDYEADKATGKRNLMVRVGLRIGVGIYSAASALVGLTLLLIWYELRRPMAQLALAAPAIALAFGLAVAVASGAWREHRIRERICGLTIVLNLLAAVAVGALAR
jgi:1,4-dihydroxy-2-naphthoate octaprenyltransferase